MNKTTCTKKNEVCNQIGCPDREAYDCSEIFNMEFSWALMADLPNSLFQNESSFNENFSSYICKRQISVRSINICQSSDKDMCSFLNPHLKLR